MSVQLGMGIDTYRSLHNNENGRRRDAAETRRRLEQLLTNDREILDVRLISRKFAKFMFNMMSPQALEALRKHPAGVVVSTNSVSSMPLSLTSSHRPHEATAST